MVLTPPCLTAISKEELLKMVGDKIDTSLIVSLVEKDCVDFDMNADNLIELANKVPNDVLKAAIDCRKRASARPQSQSNDRKVEDLKCMIYKELTSHPGLRDFPLIVSSINNGYVTITGVKASRWAQEQTGDAYSFFRYVELHQEYADKAIATARRIQDIKDVEFKINDTLSTAAVRSEQQNDISQSCPNLLTADGNKIDLTLPVDAIVTQSGLASEVIKPGTGTEHPAASSTVTVHYSGWTTDGNMFDSSRTRGQPATFGLDQVVPGWTEGLQLMVAGEIRRFWMPEKLTYQGRAGAPQGMLVFEVELLNFH